MEEEDNKLGRVCVTGGTGYLGSWMVKCLLQRGYSVNTTVRLHVDSGIMEKEGKRDVSYLTSLPGASDRLRFFPADLDRPDSFAPAIEGCVGVFHVAHPLDFEGKETEEVKMKRVIGGTRGILQACVDAKTVRRVVCTSTAGTVSFTAENLAGDGPATVDESSWTDLELLRKLGAFFVPYVATKTLTEKLTLDFGEENGLDVLTVLPSWINGPFICPRCPDSVYINMALFFGDEKCYERLIKTSVVHVDDVVRAHIHLFEYPQAKGRYICSAIDFTIHELHRFLVNRYPQYSIAPRDSLKDLNNSPIPSFSSKKLLETGFKYENGLEEIYDGAIKSCEDIGLLPRAI